MSEDEINELIFKEFVKNGYAKIDKGNGWRSWDVAQRKFLYLTDEQARAFLELKKMPRYKKEIAEREANLIKANAKKIKESLGNEPFNLIDIYCSDGKKACEFIKAIGKNNKIRYCPVNVNSYLVDLAVSNIKNCKHDNIVEYNPIISDGDGRTLRNLESDLKNGEFKRNVILILGTVLGSYQINEYLFELSKDMSKDDVLIIGNGIRAGKRLVDLKKYKHGIFNKWFIQLIKGLGLSEEDVEYNVRFGNSRIEMFYRINKNKTIKRFGRTIDFSSGDEILVAVLYKYYEEEFDKFCKMYFSDVFLATDEDKGYALVICRK